MKTILVRKFNIIKFGRNILHYVWWQCNHFTKYRRRSRCHILIISIELMTYLWMMMTVLSINIMHHFFVKKPWICILWIGSVYDLSKRTVHRHNTITLDLLLKKLRSFELQVFSLLFLLWTTGNYYCVWIRFVNTLIYQIT